MRAILSTAFSLLPALVVHAVQSPLPEPLPASRYEQMLEKSPFALATPPAPVKEQAAPVFANLVLTGVVPIRDAQGAESYFVSIRTRDLTERFQLFGTEPNEEGISIASVDWSPQVGKSTVTLKKGGEFGKIEFDEMVPQSIPPSGTAPRAGQLNLPGVNGMPAGANPALGARHGAGGRIPVPRPNNLGVSAGGIPRPGNAQPQAPQLPPGYGAPLPGNAPAPLPGAAPGGESRRRIRVINSKP